MTFQLKDPTAPIYDYSSHEYPVDFAGLNPKPLRAILRASIQVPGTRVRYKDANVVEFSNQCRTAGTKTGLYHFLSPNGIAEQANLFLSVWNECGGADMAPIVDAEIDLPKSYGGTIGNAVWAGHIKTFMDYVEQRIGKTCIIYTNKYYWRYACDALGRAPVWTADHPLWAAWYPDYPDQFQAPPASMLPSGWKQWAMWQYNDKGRSNGFQANDLNIASDWFKQELGTVTPPPPPAAKTPFTLSVIGYKPYAGELEKA